MTCLVATRYIQLEVGVHSAILQMATGGRGYQRLLAQFPTVNQETSGSRIIRGPVTRAPHIWTLNNFVIKTDTHSALKRVIDQALIAQETRSTTAVLLTDTIERISEVGPRTRGKAPAPFDDEIAQPGGYVDYYATFNAQFTQIDVDNGLIPRAGFRVVSLTLVELGKTTP